MVKSTLTSEELRKLPLEELVLDIAKKRIEIAGIHMAIELGKEKDTAKHKRAKRELARMLTIQTERSLQSPATPSTLSSPRARRAGAASPTKQS